MVRLQVSPSVVINPSTKPAQTLPQAPVSNSGYGRQAILTGGTLLVGDMLAICISLLASASVLYALGQSPDVLLALETLLATMFLLSTLRMYPAVGMHPAMELRGTILAATGGALTFLLLGHAALDWKFLLASFTTWGCLLVALPLGRSLTRTYSSRFRWWGIRAIVVGSGERAESIHEALRRSQRRGLRPSGWLDRDEVVAEYDQLKFTPERAIEDALTSLAASLNSHWVILLLDEEDALENTMLLRSLQRRWVHTTALYRDAAMVLPSVDASTLEIGETSGMHICNRLLTPGSMAIKRTLDLAIASMVAVIAVPLAVVLASLIKLTSRGPAFYSQERIGRSGKRFRAWKFRTMVPDADQVLSQHLETHPGLRAEWERDHKLKKDPRITKVGRLLRKTSLDELPQLWNIFRGEMSLVGPRPIVTAEIQKYGVDFPAYAGVIPGVTGLWQISGRNNTTYEERVRLDAYYVRNWSPWFDIYILVRTIKVVLLQEGAY